ncbi:MAG: caspase family protein, partial [Alphaproteobacteria bacterium]
MALVIGNAAYKAQPLANPVNDARAMARTLEQVGFQVVRVEDAGHREMTRA